MWLWGMQYRLHVLLESEAFGHLSEALPAEVGAILPYHGVVLAAAYTRTASLSKFLGSRPLLLCHCCGPSNLSICLQCCETRSRL